MKLEPRQIKRLELLGYKPCEGHLNLFPEDFKNFSIWEEVLQSVGLSEARGFTVAICGVREDEGE